MESMDWVVSHKMDAATAGALNCVPYSSVVLFVFVFLREEIANIAPAVDMADFTEVQQLLFSC